MPIDAELYDLVKAAKKSLRDENKPVNARAVIKLVGRRNIDTLVVYNELDDQEQAEREAEEEKLFNANLKNALINYGEDYAQEKTLILKNKINRHQDSEELLIEEISALNEELSDSQNQAEKEQSELSVTINDLQKIKSDIEDATKTQLGEIKALRSERDAAYRKRDEIEARITGLKQTLAVKSAEAKTERTRTNNLQAQLDQSTEEHKDATKRLERTDRKNVQLQEKISGLDENLKLTRKQLKDEQKARSEADNLRAAAESRLDASTERLKEVQTKLDTEEQQTTQLKKQVFELKSNLESIQEQLETEQKNQSEADN